MPLLGLLWGASGLTSVGRYLIIAVAGLFALGLLVNGIVAPYKRQIADLQSYAKSLESAAENREKIIEADKALAEDDLRSRDALREKVMEILNAPISSSPTCRLSADQLSKLRAVANH